MEPGCTTQGNHIFERGTEAVHDIAIFCGDHCETHKPATPKEWGAAPPQAIDAKQENLFDSR